MGTVESQKVARLYEGRGQARVLDARRSRECGEIKGWSAMRRARHTLGAGRRGARTAVAVAMLGGGCAGGPPGGWPLGTTIEHARGGWMGPQGEYALPGGRTRLEFDQGRQTYMLDFDAAGLLVAKQQVLAPDSFEDIHPGMSEADVRSRLGRPSHVFAVAWQSLRVWNYRYVGGDCVWFQVSILDATRQVSEAAYGMDPACAAGPNTKN